MTPYFLILICLSDSVIHLRHASGCDDATILKIKAFRGIQTQQNIVQTVIDNKEEVIVSTTEGYFDDDVTCVSTVFDQDSVTYTRYHEQGGPTTDDIKMYAKDGVLYETNDPGETDLIIDIIEEYVTYCYKCNTDHPVVAVKVKEGEYNADTLIAAKTKMEEFFGIELTKTYPDKCK